jgi:hypothetical protein
MKRSHLIDLSEIHSIDVRELETFSELPTEVWEAILNESVFPFPIFTFKLDGVWRAINAGRMRSADGRRPDGRNSLCNRRRISTNIVSHSSGKCH